MRPVLFWLRLRGGERRVPVPAFIVLLATGYLTGVLGAHHDFVALGWPGWSALLLLVATAAGAMLGAVVHFRAVTRWVARLEPGPPSSGASMIGGLLGGALLVVTGTLAMGRSPVAAIDVMAPWIFIGTAIGRVGCLLAGCDYGRPVRARLWPSIRYPNWAISEPELGRHGAPAFLLHRARGWVARDAARSAPVHPVPVYWALTLAASGVGLRGAGTTLAIAGATVPRSLVALWVFAVLTWLLEPIRGDADRGIVGGISVAMWSTLVAVVALTAAWRLA